MITIHEKLKAVNLSCTALHPNAVAVFNLKCSIHTDDIKLLTRKALSVDLVIQDKVA